MEYRIYELLKEAWETSTRNYNRFSEAISNIKWDGSYSTKDDSIVFYLGGFQLECYNDDGIVNPFTEWMPPEVLFSDHSIICFDSSLSWKWFG